MCPACHPHRASLSGTRADNMAPLHRESPRDWNGTEWSAVTVLTPEGAKETRLYGVACSSANSCTAVGESYEVAYSPIALAETWNGKEWKPTAVQLPSGTKVSYLHAAACISTYCTAVGAYGATAPTNTLEGTTGQPTVQTEAASNVTATGATLKATTDPNGRETTYHFEYGETTSYGTKVPVPDAKLSSTVTTSAVSQTIAGLEPETTYHYRIVATNPSGASDGADHTFTTGVLPWSVRSTPNPSGAEESVLKGVSCASSLWCAAVGFYDAGSEAPLAELWNGTSWSLSTPSSPSGAKSVTLEGVSCASSTACTAVGYYTNSSGAYEPLTERWNGTTWTIQSTPAAPAKKSYLLYGIACTSTSSCIAVGSVLIGFHELEPLAETWNGTEWKLMTVPGTGGLVGISCVSASACTAVGETDSEEPLAESWNGKEWVTQKAAKISEAALLSVSCVSSTSCIAVGYKGGQYGAPTSGISESWNGTEWSVVTVPTPAGAKETRLYGVACSSAKSCTAVGESYEVAYSPIALAETWNGKEWKVVSLPLPSGVKQSAWSAVSCASTFCTASGHYTSSSGYLTLVDSN